VSKPIPGEGNPLRQIFLEAVARSGQPMPDEETLREAWSGLGVPAQLTGQESFFLAHAMTAFHADELLPLLGCTSEEIVEALRAWLDTNSNAGHPFFWPESQFLSPIAPAPVDEPDAWASPRRDLRRFDYPVC
jgi:hypothetical protein